MLACLSASNLQIAKLKSPDITRVFTFCTLLADCSFFCDFFSVFKQCLPAFICLSSIGIIYLLIVARAFC